MNDLYEKDRWVIAIPNDDMNLRNILITRQFSFVTETRLDAIKSLICNNEKELYDVLSDFYGDY